MKLHSLLGKSSSSSPSFVDAVRNVAFQVWKRDGYLPLDDHIATPAHLDDDDSEELDEFVDDVVGFARKNNIKDPQQAVELYTHHLSQSFAPKAALH